MIRVLYVDDEPMLLEILNEVLADEPDIEVLVSDSPQSVLASDMDVDVIISDYQMPTMDGIGFLKGIRETSDIPFILFTGKGREEVVINAFNEGADAYVQKGTDTTAQFRELVHQVRQLYGRKCSETALRKSEGVTMAMMQNSNGAVIKIDPDGMIESINDFGLERIGMTLDETIGLRAVDALSPSVGWEDSLGEVLSGECSEGMVQHDLDTGRRWFNWSVRALDDERSGVVALGTDVTGLVNAERRLERSEAHYKGLVETCMGIVVQTGLDMRVSFINPFGAENLGIPASDIVGTDVEAVLLRHVEDPLPTVEMLLSGPNSTVIGSLVNASGSTRWISWSIASMRDSEGRAMGFVMNGTDITDLREAQDVLHRMNAVLEAFNEVGRITTHVDSRREMMDSIVRRLVEVDGLESALMMVGHEDVYELSHVTYGEPVPSFIDRVRKGMIPIVAREALSSDWVVVVDSPSERCVDCDLASVCGGDVSMSCRLEYEGRVHGIISASMSSGIAHLPDMEMMFQRIADDIGIALSHLELDEERTSHLAMAEMYERIMNGISDPISIVNPDYSYRVINKGYEKLFNARMEDIIGRRVGDLMGERTFEGKIKRHMDRALRGDVVHYEDWIEFPARGVIPIRMRYDPLYDDEGSIEGVVVIGAVIEDEMVRDDDMLVVSNEADSLYMGRMPGLTVTSNRESFSTDIDRGRFGRVFDLIEREVFTDGQWVDMERLCGEGELIGLVNELLRLLIRHDVRSLSDSLMEITCRPSILLTRSDDEGYTVIGMNSVAEGSMDERPIRVADGAVWTALEDVRVTGSYGYSSSHLPIFRGEGDGFLMFPLSNRSVFVIVGGIVGHDPQTRSAMVNEAIVDISDVLMDRTYDMGALTRTILSRSRSLTGSEHGYVSTIDPDSGSNVCHTLTDMMGDSCRITGKDSRIVFPVGDDGRHGGLFGHSLNTGEAFYVNTPSTHPSSIGVPDGHIPLRNFLSVPAMDGDEVIGQIALANRDGEYDDEDLDAVRKLAETYSLAIRLRSSEMGLRQSQDMFTHTFDNVDIGMTLTDPNGRFLRVNKALRTLTGHSDEDFLSKDCIPFVSSPAQMGRWGHDFAKLMGGVSDSMVEDVTLIRKDGGAVDVHVKSSLVRDENGEPSFITSVFEDVTDHNSTLRNLESMNTKLDLLGKVTRHDIQNQLTALSAYLELAKGRRDDADYLRRGQRVCDNIRSILSFGQDYECLGKDEPMWMDLGDAFERGTSTIDLDGIDVDLDVNDLEVWADGMLEKVFHNLVDNSLRHGGHVSRVSLYYDDKGRIVYEDDGDGIPDVVRATLFDPARRHGMNMARSILGLTGISIEEDCGHGTGARFVITIPDDCVRQGDREI